MSRLGKTAESYIKTSLLLESVSINEWLWPLGSELTSLKQKIIPVTDSAPCICSRCGFILGECIGGAVATSCFNCYNQSIKTRFWIVAERLKKEAYPLDISYEIALVLKEIYHGRNCVIQRSSL